MNIKLIEKLAKLANNNPNENEANMAARKVCKLLAEGNFKFTNEPIIYPKPPFQQPSTNITYDYIQEMMNQMQRERQTREYRNMYNEPIFNPFQDPRHEKQQKQNKMRDLICTKCNTIKKTRYQGPEFNFICMECIGK